MTQLDPMPTDGKAAVHSTTYWGLATTALGLILPPILAHYHVGGLDAQDIIEGVGKVADGVGLIIAAGGRLNASRPITSILPQKG